MGPPNQKGGISMIHTNPGQNLQQVLDDAAPGSELRLAPGEYRIKSAIFALPLDNFFTVCYDYRATQLYS